MNECGVWKMVSGAKALAPKLDSLSSIFGAHLVEVTNDSHKLSSDLHIYQVT